MLNRTNHDTIINIVISVIRQNGVLKVNTVTANQLKTKGVSAVEERLKESEEVVISVRGKDRFVVMDLEKYNKLREYELTIALQEARADVEEGRYTVESVANHIQQVADV